MLMVFAILRSLSPCYIKRFYYLFFSLFQKINWPVDVLFGSVLAFSCINFSFFIADRKFGWGNKFEDQKGVRKDMGLLDS